MRALRIASPEIQLLVEKTVAASVWLTTAYPEGAGVSLVTILSTEGYIMPSRLVFYSRCRYVRLVAYLR